MGTRETTNISTRTLIRFKALFALVFCVTLHVYADDKNPPLIHFKPHAVERIATFDSPDLDEISGFALSSINPDRIWTLNDSDNPPNIFAINTAGKVEAKIQIANATNTDWEAIAAFRMHDLPYLLIGDIGDNGANRTDYTLYAVREPNFAQTQKPTDIAIEWLIHFRYEDGAKDAESLAIDENRNRIIIVSKRTTPPQIYEIPLQPAEDKRHPVIARKQGIVVGMVKPNLSEFLFSSNAVRFGGQPTDFAISPDGKTGLVLTYSRIYRYKHKTDETWAETLSRQPDAMMLPEIPQAESLTWDRDGKTVFVSTEQKKAPLYKITLDE